MDLVTVLMALLLPWLVGIVWLRRLCPSWPLLLGYSYPLGMVVLTLLMQFTALLGLALNFWLIASLLVILMALGLWFLRGVATPVVATDHALAFDHLPYWQQWVFWFFLVLLILRFVGLGLEIAWRPLTPWDAWTTWGLRARVWSELGELVPFIAPEAWLAQPAGTAYTIPAWHYPAAISLLQTWMTLAWGQWQASVANLPWLLCAFALALGFYGQARQLGASALLALLFVYLLFSLPILNVHIALAGYADLWLATLYGLAALALLQWLHSGDRRQGILALLLALACPLIKLEGAVWLLTLLPVLIFRLRAWQPLIVFMAGLGLGATWYVIGGVSLGRWQLTPTLIELPYLGRFPLSYVDNWAELFEHLFIRGSWHLLWYALLIMSLVALPRIVRSRRLLAATLLLASGLGMLFVLFFMTEAEAWVRRGTSINRLLLHLAPLVLFYLLLLSQALAPPKVVDKAALSVPQPAQ